RAGAMESQARAPATHSNARTVALVAIDDHTRQLRKRAQFIEHLLHVWIPGIPRSGDVPPKLDMDALDWSSPPNEAKAVAATASRGLVEDHRPGSEQPRLIFRHWSVVAPTRANPRKMPARILPA